MSVYLFIFHEIKTTNSLDVIDSLFILHNIEDSHTGATKFEKRSYRNRNSKNYPISLSFSESQIIIIQKILTVVQTETVDFTLIILVDMEGCYEKIASGLDKCKQSPLPVLPQSINLFAQRFPCNTFDRRSC